MPAPRWCSHCRPVRRVEDGVDRRAGPRDRRRLGALQAPRQGIAVELQDLDAGQGVAEDLQPLRLDRMEEGEGRERAQTQGSEYVLMLVKLFTASCTPSL